MLTPADEFGVGRPVGPEAAVHEVAAAAALQQVVAAAAGQRVAAGRALEHVDAAVTGQGVGRGGAGEIFDADEFVAFGVAAVGGTGIERDADAGGGPGIVRCVAVNARAQDPVQGVGAAAAPQDVVAGLAK